MAKCKSVVAALLAVCVVSPPAIWARRPTALARVLPAKADAGKQPVTGIANAPRGVVNFQER